MSHSFGDHHKLGQDYHRYQQAWTGLTKGLIAAVIVEQILIGLAAINKSAEIYAISHSGLHANDEKFLIAMIIVRVAIRSVEHVINPLRDWLPLA